MMLTFAAATCLALNVYFEGRGEDYDGQKMISEVVLTRTETAGFPTEICDVVWEKGQFSWTHDGKSDRPRDAAAWLQAQIIANETLLFGCEFCTGATHYATVDAHPYWASTMKPVGMWGNHIFYIQEHKLPHPKPRPEWIK